MTEPNQTTGLGIRRIAGVSLGNAVGAGIQLGGMVILVAFYSPSEIGAFAVASAIALTSSAVIAGRLELAIPLPKADSEARGVMGLGSIIASGVIVVWTCLALLAPEPLLFGSGGSRMLACLVPLTLAPIAASQLLNAWALRLGNLRAVALRPPVQAVAMTVAQVLAGQRHLGSTGLMLGLLVGQAAGAASLLWACGWPGRLRWADIGRAWGAYRSFPTYLMPSGLLNALATQIPVIFVSAFFGVSAAGHFALTQRVLAAPTFLLGQAAASVFMGDLAASIRQKPAEAYRVFMRTSRLLLCCAAVVAPVTIVFAPLVFEVFFGTEWRVSGDIGRAWAVLMAADLVAMPVSVALVAYNRLGQQLTLDIVRITVVSGSFWICDQLSVGLVSAIWIVSIATAAVQAASWLLSRRAVAAGQAAVLARR